VARTWLRFGDWLATCDVCGLVFHASQLKDRWDGLKVCREDWEPRHPQDMIRIPRTEKSPPWTRPEPDGIDIDVDYIETGTTACTSTTMLAQSDWGTADCMRVGNVNSGLLPD